MLSVISLLLCVQSRHQVLPQERTVFQTGSPYSDRIDIRADVAIVYGIDKSMPERIRSWRAKGYRVHLMTGVAWGEYQDYYYGRWDGVNHEDEAQTRANGEKVGHGGDVYYMSPGARYGRFLADGVKKALEAGVEAVHLEEPEFWTYGGYGAGFKREWQAYYHQPWQDPQSSPDARWRAAKLMYFLYRRALQQIFDSIRQYNHEHSTRVRCYVPTHSLINYAHWNIVSPESSLARLKGCDGYIAQVWTGTARTPNFYQGVKKERTFESAFLEYGSMQNLVRATGRRVWYLADPIEDNPDHDWGDYRRNWESTVTASLLQPDVFRYEVLPWPERVFNGRYPSESDKSNRVTIPRGYSTELQIVFNALKEMKQDRVRWESGTNGLGVAVSDSLMFQRGGPSSSDEDMGHFYGLALPLLKRGFAVQPVQLESVGLPGYLKGLKVLLMSYEGMKPLDREIHAPIAKWVRAGGTLMFVDSDSDPFLRVSEWWNSHGLSYGTPREELFNELGLTKDPAEGIHNIGKGSVVFLKRSPTSISHDPAGGEWLAQWVHRYAPGLSWNPTSSIVLRRGPYVVAAGMDETNLPPKTLKGNFVDLYDPQLQVLTAVEVKPSCRHLLVDLDLVSSSVVASAGAVTIVSVDGHHWRGTIEGVSQTEGVLMLRLAAKPISVTVGSGGAVDQKYDPLRKLLWLKFVSSSNPQIVDIRF